MSEEQNVSKADTPSPARLGSTWCTSREARHELPAKEKNMSEKQTIEAGNSSPPPLGRTRILTSDQWACCNCRNRDYDGSCKLSGKQTSMTDYCAGYRQASF